MTTRRPWIVTAAARSPWRAVARLRADGVRDRQPTGDRVDEGGVSRRASPSVWKLTQPWTHRTRPPLLAKRADAFRTAPTTPHHFRVPDQPDGTIIGLTHKEGSTLLLPRPSLRSDA